MCKSSYRKSIEHVFYKRKKMAARFQKGHGDKCLCHWKALTAAKVEEIKENDQLLCSHTLKMEGNWDTE